MEQFEKETVTVAEMKQLEKASNAAGLSYMQMMENAGKAAAEITRRYGEKRFGPEKKLSALIFCGKGNNGGDGFVAARKLAEAGWKVRVILVEGDPATEDARANFERIRHAVPVVPMDAADGDYDIVLDAVYGTGFHGELRENGKKAVAKIEELHRKGALIIALDIPSGLSGDGGTPADRGKCVFADVTITFHSKKPVHEDPAAQKALGEVVTADIGIRKCLREAACE